ncbi:binding--dependent transport system inner membrane component family protein [Candidatus Endolissoclinum faulkneri L2]|uniref:Binding--dependent transport system inner membrane component family protein n=1 Tax=Candidatus Endolissoclinum faulkneri L2 TaxID=1193729 RepID=K7YFZ1_9PROT|nr:ABC transporter permease [Candidatus Endolissoclinum faulkneri]AFX98505.1 binding--dependent transport system inner membrane component family protein [Candidatus Endolissoclinum faulkneri L2]
MIEGIEKLVRSVTSDYVVMRMSTIWQQLIRNSSIMFGAIVLGFVVFIAISAPFLDTMDPSAIDLAWRNNKPGVRHFKILPDGTTREWTYRMGTDTLGRDTYSRVIYGAQVSLAVGSLVAMLSLTIGLIIGLVAGYVLWLDAIVLRIMDGLMAVPGILLAITMVSLANASLLTLILAIAIPEIPRVVRLVRSIVLSIRDEPYVEAAVSVGTRLPMILIRHLLPNIVAPLIVMGTYIFASAILVEAILSFLGVGISPETPTWGNIMAEGRLMFRIYPHNILFPGIFLAITLLAVNMLGDGLRDILDPRIRKRL